MYFRTHDPEIEIVERVAPLLMKCVDLPHHECFAPCMAQCETKPWTTMSRDGVPSQSSPLPSPKGTDSSYQGICCTRTVHLYNVSAVMHTCRGTIANIGEEAAIKHQVHASP